MSVYAYDVSMVHNEKGETMLTHVTTRVASGRTYAALDTGERWNGSPVLAFTHETIRAMIAAGDGADSNGEGLQYDRGWVKDVTDGQVTRVPEIMGMYGDALYVPEGRVWDVVTVHAVHPADGLTLCATAEVDPVTTDDVDAVTCDDCREAM